MTPAPSVSGGAFVGRERERAELHAGLRDALAGRGRLFLIVGEVGIGKTRLATGHMSRTVGRDFPGARACESVHSAIALAVAG